MHVHRVSIDRVDVVSFNIQRHFFCQHCCDYKKSCQKRKQVARHLLPFFWSVALRHKIKTKKKRRFLPIFAKPKHKSFNMSGVTVVSVSLSELNSGGIQATKTPPRREKKTPQTSSLVSMCGLSVLWRSSGSSYPSTVAQPRS